jgi:signal transduction histidine kinase
MTIRTRLAVQFLALASLIMGTAFVVVYLLSAAYRAGEFQDRMRDRGTHAAKLLIQVEEVDEALLLKIERNSTVRLPEESIRIYDHHDSLIFQLAGEAQPPAPKTLLDQVRLEEEVSSVHGLQEELAFTFNDQYDRFVVIVTGKDIFGRSKLRNLGRVLFSTFLIGTLLTFLVARFYAQRALSPVKRLVAELRGIGAADLSRRVQVDNDRDELAQLASSFNELLSRLQEAFQAQKNFIANASHEMRTPLTTISGQIDVLLLRDRSTEEYRKVLVSVLEDMHTLNRLADRLLLLAQAETQGTATTFAPVRMDEVVWSARAELLKAEPGHTCHVSIEEVEDEADLMVSGNEMLLRSLIFNLMDNACKYAPDRTAHVALKGPGPVVRIAVSDHGPGISEQDLGRIFEPFFRATNTSGAKGHGIGLSLALRIAQLHGGGIKVRSVAGEGTRFTVRLPKAG